MRTLVTLKSIDGWTGEGGFGMITEGTPNIQVISTNRDRQPMTWERMPDRCSIYMAPSNSITSPCREMSFLCKVIKAELKKFSYMLNGHNPFSSNSLLK